LKKMTQHENARVRGDNKPTTPIKNNIIQLPVIRPEPAPTPPSPLPSSIVKAAERSLGTCHSACTRPCWIREPWSSPCLASMCVIPHPCRNEHRPHQPST
jgi:hypothetical protein